MKNLIVGARLFLALTVLCGVLYPIVTTLLAELAFPTKTRGSILSVEGKKIGSQLIGQEFTSSRYFWGRLSATGPYSYNGAVSGGSNLAPSNPALLDKARARIEAMKSNNTITNELIPVDLVTSSGSGLDPHISPASARIQAGRVARERGISLDEVEKLISENIEQRTLGILGEPRINVLRLNLLLDKKVF